MNRRSPTFMEVEGRPGAQRVLRVVAAFTVVANGTYVVSILEVHRGPGAYATFWDGWLFHVATTLPAVLAAFRAIVDRRSRAAWWLVATGIVLNTVANLIYTYHDQNLRPIPFPAVSDIPFLASYVAFAAALLLITQYEARDASKATRLDGLVIGLSTAAVAVAIWFASILRQTGSSSAVLVGLAYPLFDVMFIVIVISGLAPARFRPTWSAACFMVGAAVFALGDVVYLNQQASGTYVPGTPLEWTWLGGIMLFGFAPWAPDRTRVQHGDRSASTLVLPVTAAMMALAVLVLGLSGQVPPLASWLAVAAIAAVLLRVGLTVRELKDANLSFRQARTDELTHLMNRRGFIEEVDRRLLGDSPRLAVMVLDLDGFKEVNDSLGHHAGDQLLAVLGARFGRAVGKRAIVARLGGDEFGLLLEASADQAEALAHRLQRSLADPIALDGISIRVGASIGLALAPIHGNTRVELLRAADVAMYDAKAGQRGIAWYSAETDPHSRSRLSLIEDLRTAIERRTFDMHYQPTIDVGTGRVIGMEALIRWQHPERGLMDPAEFIPLAERVGLIPAITRAVLDLSISHLADVVRHGHQLQLSVNISARDLVDENLPDYVRTVLSSYGIDPRLLTLEITETALSSDAVRAERTLTALRIQGVRISIDDFGVGYSSMSQLLQLPLDELKLDRSFIANLGDDRRAQAILSATVELGRSLGLTIVAEGVETMGALDEVVRRGVDTAQGYLFSQALDPLHFHQYLIESDVEYGISPPTPCPPELPRRARRVPS